MAAVTNNNNNDSGNNTTVATTMPQDLTEAIVQNPGVTGDHLYAALTEAYVDAQQNYKFVHRPSGMRLEPGVKMTIVGHTIVLTWVFRDAILDKQQQQAQAAQQQQQQDRKVLARFEQKVLAACRPDPADEKRYIVTLRPRSTKSLLQDVFDTISESQIDTTLLPTSAKAQAAAAALAASIAAKELAIRRAQEEKARLEQKEREEKKRQEDERRAKEKAELEAAMRPLPPRPAPSFGDQNFRGCR
jgi:hypothetical protein